MTVEERGSPAAAKCPVLHDNFTMLDDDFLRDPYAVYRRLRAQPVYFSEAHSVYVITRYDDVDAVFSQPEVFSSSVVLSPVTPVSAKAQEILASVDYHRPPNLISADPPGHTKIRRFVQHAMSPRAAAGPCNRSFASGPSPGFERWPRRAALTSSATWRSRCPR